MLKLVLLPIAVAATPTAAQQSRSELTFAVASLAAYAIEASDRCPGYRLNEANLGRMLDQLSADERKKAGEIALAMKPRAQAHLSERANCAIVYDKLTVSTGPLLEHAQ